MTKPSAGESRPTKHVDDDRDVRLGQIFVRLADSLVTGFDVADLLTDLVRACVDFVGAAAAGLVLADQHKQLRLMATSSDEAELLELLELQTKEGPCLDCYLSGAPVFEEDESAQATQWPALAGQLRKLGYGATYSVPLRLREQTLGALNLFGLAGEPLPAADLQLAQAMADVATISLVQHRIIRAGHELTGQLQTALNTRIAIEQAKGVIAEHAKVDMNRAFEILRSHSRNTHARLSELAAEIAAGRISPATLLRAARTDN